MKNVLKKLVSLCLALSMITALVPLSAFAALGADTIEYSYILGSTGWTKSERIHQEWDTKSGKALGSYNSSGTLLASATQGTTAPDGSLAVKFTFPKDASKPYMHFASIDRKSAATSMYVPNTAGMGYLEFDVYTTGDSLVSMDFNPQVPKSNGKNDWPAMKYTFDTFTANEWHTIRIPFSDCTVGGGYTWRDAKAFDNLRFYLPATVTQDTDIYVKNMSITYSKADAERYDYSTIISVNGWALSNRIWEYWEMKGVGVWSGKSYTDAKQLSIPEQNVADPVLGTQNSVKFSLAAGNENPFILFASKNRKSADTCIMVPTSRPNAYLRFSIYTTDLTPDRIVFYPETTDGGWPTMVYTVKEELTKNTWHDFEIPLSQLEHAKYTWKDIKAVDAISFWFDQTVSAASEVYIKNMAITYSIADNKIIASNDAPAIGDTVKFRAVGDCSVLEDSSKYTMLIAAYDADKNLISAMPYTSNAVDYTVAEGTKYISAYLWSDLTNMAPIAGKFTLNVAE